MKYYHASQDATVGTILSPNYRNYKPFISPFVLSAAAGEDTFIATQQAARYQDELMRLHGLKQYTDSQKWATEGILEYIRCEKFPSLIPRYNSIFLFDSAMATRKFKLDYFKNDESMRIFVTQDISSEHIKMYDMGIFNTIFELVKQSFQKGAHNFAKSLALAEKYWEAENISSNKEYLSSIPILLASEIK